MKINKNSEEVITNKILDLMLWYQIEDSNAWLRVLESQIKFLEERRKQLVEEFNKCLFKFQKKKVSEEFEKVEQELFKQYENIGEEVSIINKLKSAIANDGKYEDGNDELISYYDLLSFLRFGITFEKFHIKNLIKKKYIIMIAKVIILLKIQIKKVMFFKYILVNVKAITLNLIEILRF